MTSPSLSPSLQAVVISTKHKPLVTKCCLKCRKHLPLTEFGLDRHASDGLKRWCKKCRAISAGKRTANKLTHFQNIASATVYFIANEYKPEHVKIGFTTSFYSRFKDHLCSTSGQLLLLSLISVESQEEEYTLHQKFKNLRINPESEWFLAKSPLLSHLSTLDQSLAHQTMKVLTPYQQSRIIIPPIYQYIDLVPFL